MTERDEILAKIEAKIARCRKAITECDNWSPAQAEWSRARDQLLDLRDEVLAMPASYEVVVTSVRQVINGKAGE